MVLAERLDDINEYYFSQKLREIESMNADGKKVINLGIGSPDLPPHPSVTKMLHAESLKPGTHGYQNYKGVVALRTAVANWYQKWYNVNLDPATEVLPLMGSKEGIVHICMTYINKGDIVLVPNPGYPTYRSAVLLAGGVPVDYDLTFEGNWKPDFAQIEETLAGRHCKLMFVNYPHMPTGHLPDNILFECLVTFAQKMNLLLVHDNPYSFILNSKPMSMLSVPGAKDVVIELNSLSKSHNMAGWRVGMLVGGKDRIQEVLKFKSNMDSGMFLPVQLAAAKALTLGKGWHDKLNRVYGNRQALVFELLNLLNCQYSKKQGGMFVWASTPGDYSDGYALSDRILAEANVFITPGGIFGSNGDQFVRVSLCSSEEKIKKAIKRIKKIL
jgi:LL-diaminopimelate aminotransferase